MPVDLSRVITVIIPTYNRCKRLQKAVQSVLDETRVPLILHIFDNASTDDTEIYVRAKMAEDSRVQYFRGDENVGSQKNYIRALGSISTKYFVPLADDDWLLPNFLADSFQILEKESRAGAAVFVTEHRSEAGALIGTYPAALDKITFGLLEPAAHLREWMTYGHYAWSSILWRTETLTFLKPPYMHVGLPSDVDFQGQIFCKYPVYIVNRPGAVYLSHGAQASGTVDIRSVPEFAALFKRLDRTIGRFELFSLEEYLPLRETMYQRFVDLWGRPARVSLTHRQMVAIAAVAGFRLGDWRLCFSLLDGMGGEKCASLTAPKLSRGNLLSILLWLKDKHDRSLRGAVNEVERKAAALRDELDIRNGEAGIRNDTIAALNAALEQLGEEKREVESQYRRLSSNRFVRLLAKLKLIEL